MPATIASYVEVGAKRAFAGAVEWPGWCRAGRDPEAALENLRAYAKGTGADRTRAAVLDALAVTAVEGPPPPGPRGGRRWLPRSFVRRVAWHVLDHAWEIQDRAG